MNYEKATRINQPSAEVTAGLKHFLGATIEASLNFNVPANKGRTVPSEAQLCAHEFCYSLLIEDFKKGEPSAVITIEAYNNVVDFLKAKLTAKDESQSENSHVWVQNILQSPTYQDHIRAINCAFAIWLDIQSSYHYEITVQKQKEQEYEIASIEPYPVHTTQEVDILYRAQCNGKGFKGYLSNDQASMIAYELTGLPHQIRLALTDDERTDGLTMAYLENLVRSQDADAVKVTAYILGTLAPAAPLPARALASGWIEFDDVIEKIHWYPQTAKERRKMHARIWDFIKYGERAHISGKRSGPRYKDHNHNEIDTTIHGAAWRVMKTETLDCESSETPIRAQIVVSNELMTLITHPKTAQYLPMGEALGAIPTGQPAGAWAYSIGLALASFWRRNPRETINGTMQPTRRELLDHFTAKVNPYNKIFKKGAKNPARVIEYYCEALRILVDARYIERTGDAKITAKEMRDNLPRQGWKDVWLDGFANIEPGAERMEPAIIERAEALPPIKPRDLKTKPRAKRKLKIQ